MTFVCRGLRRGFWIPAPSRRTPMATSERLYWTLRNTPKTFLSYCKNTLNKKYYFYFVLFSRTTPLPLIGLWTFEPTILFSPLVSGFPSQITWLPVAWAHNPILTTGQRFLPPEVPLVTWSLSTNQEPPFVTNGRTLLLASIKMKSTSQLDDWSLKYLEHGMNGETKLPLNEHWLLPTTTILPSCYH